MSNDETEQNPNKPRSQQQACKNLFSKAHVSSLGWSAQNFNQQNPPVFMHHEIRGRMWPKIMLLLFIIHVSQDWWRFMVLLC